MACTPHPLQLGGGVKNFRKAFTGEAGNFYFGGGYIVGGGGRGGVIFLGGGRGAA